MVNFMEQHDFDSSTSCNPNSIFILIMYIILCAPFNVLNNNIDTQMG